jgi:hypothetical protein
MDTQLCMTNFFGAYVDNEADRHRWGFDARSLKEFLMGCGFKKVIPFDWRSIAGADIARAWWVLGAEAIK